MGQVSPALHWFLHNTVTSILGCAFICSGLPRDAMGHGPRFGAAEPHGRPGHVPTQHPRCHDISQSSIDSRTTRSGKVFFSLLLSFTGFPSGEKEEGRLSWRPESLRLRPAQTLWRVALIRSCSFLSWFSLSLSGLAFSKASAALTASFASPHIVLSFSESRLCLRSKRTAPSKS